MHYKHASSLLDIIILYPLPLISLYQWHHHASLSFSRHPCDRRRGDVLCWFHKSPTWIYCTCETGTEPLMQVAVYSSPQEADLWKIRSVFMHFVSVLQLVRWSLLLKLAVDICSLRLWCCICWYRLITLLCLRFNNFVRYITFHSELYCVYTLYAHNRYCGYTMLRYSWWWTVDVSETCRVLYQISLRNSASRWFLL
jgi:hypothetical protein